MESLFHATTIIAVKKGRKTAIAGDGQVTMGNSIVMKNTARKIRTLYNGKVIAGFAGSVADAFTLFEKFEEHLRHDNGNLLKAAVNLSKEWRSDKVLRQLEALLIVADASHLLILSGNGEVIEPDDGVATIGSGGSYALAAARTMLKYTDMEADEIVEAALHIAADICVYTNHQVIVEMVEQAE